jgi:glucokinase
MKILAADIGGTKTLVHIAEVHGAHIKVLHQSRFISKLYRDFETLLREFLDQAPALLRDTISGACFGVAGPISGPAGGPRQAMITNLPWHIDETKLRDLLQISRVCLINDFFATASGIEALNNEDLDVLNPGSGRPRAPRLVVGAGTGLGVAQILWCDGRYRAFASEGGHIHFAPTDALQIELLGYLLKLYGRVSYERLLSGTGLVNIHQFLALRKQATLAAEPHSAEEAPDPAAVIVDLARSGDLVARQALSMFISIYGATVGDLALVSLAYGGIYIAGGIAPKLRMEMREGGFVEAYGQKGRMSPLVKQMPVSIILSQDIGLLGASLVASRLQGS